MKKILIVYTDRFSRRNIETSDLISLLSEKGFIIETVEGIGNLSGFKSLLFRFKSKLYEIIKYRFLEVKNIKKQQFKHRFKNQKNLISYDKLNTRLGFPFPKSELILNLLSKIFVNLPSCVENHDADLILITNMQDAIAQSYIKYAESKRIKILPLVNSWDHLTHGGPAIKSSAVPFYMVWNKIQKNELKTIHDIDESKIEMVGALQYDYLIDIARKSEGQEYIKSLFNIKQEKKIIFLPAYNFRHGKYEPFAIKKLIEHLSEIKEEIHILIRPYPTDTTFKERFSDVLKEPCVTAAELSDDMLTDRKIMSLLLKNSDVVLSGCGTAAIEAMYYDTPVIHIPIDERESHEIDTIEKSNYFSDHYVHIVNAKASILVYTVEELISAVNTFLTDPGHKREERKTMIDEQLFLTHGKSSGCIADKVEGVLL